MLCNIITCNVDYVAQVLYYLWTAGIIWRAKTQLKPQKLFKFLLSNDTLIIMQTFPSSSLSLPPLSLPLFLPLFLPLLLYVFYECVFELTLVKIYIMGWFKERIYKENI